MDVMFDLLCVQRCASSIPVSKSSHSSLPEVTQLAGAPAEPAEPLAPALPALLAPPLPLLEPAAPLEPAEPPLVAPPPPTLLLAPPLAAPLTPTAPADGLAPACAAPPAGAPLPVDVASLEHACTQPKHRASAPVPPHAQRLARVTLKRPLVLNLSEPAGIFGNFTGFLSSGRKPANGSPHCHRLRLGE
jgi:hypothetical protein